MCRREETGDSPLEGDSHVAHKAFSFFRQGEKQIGSQGLGGFIKGWVFTVPDVISLSRPIAAIVPKTSKQK